MLTYNIRHADISYNQFEDEIIVIDLASGRYFSLRGSAAIIWTGLQQGPASAESLSKLFDSVDEAGLAHLAAFLRELASFDLLGASDTPACSASLEGPAAIFDAPRMEIFSDLQDLLLADPIHDVAEAGWPNPPDTSRAA